MLVGIFSIAYFREGILTVNFTEAHTELQRVAKFRGLYSRVARRLDVSVQHVIEVSKGRRHSARVMRAVEREYRKILDRERAA